MAMQRGRHYQGRPRTIQNGNIERLANALGWFSIGLGLAEVVAPGAVARFIGISDRPERKAILRFYGFREMAAGVGILSQSRPAGWVWGRVAGDLLDLASLGSAMSSDGVNQTRANLATAAVLGVTALDVYCGQQLTRSSSTSGYIHVAKTITINRPPEEVYSFWRNFENFSTFMDHLESVRVTGNRRSHWKTKPVAGKTVEWDAEIIREQPNSLIEWRSIAGDLDGSGSVRFERATGGRGTVVRVRMEYAPPGGTIGATIAKLLGTEPEQQVDKALRRLKQILETGGIVRSESGIHRSMHAAQPPASPQRVPASGTRYHTASRPMPA